MLKRLTTVVLILALLACALPAQGAYETLRRGAKGDQVRQLQTALKDLGLYTKAIDGVYGAGTISAVRAFQKKSGLTADGVAGPKTLQALYAGSAAAAEQEEAADVQEAVEEEEGTATAVEPAEETAASAETKTPSAIVLSVKKLQKGSKGADVKTLQTVLKDFGYYTKEIDGVYGTGTVSAVRAFQKKNGLSSDGIAGAKTIEKLNTLLRKAQAKSASQPAAEAEGTETDAAAMLTRIAEESGAACGTLVLSKDGKTIVTWSFGGVSEDTCFRIASVTKWVTAIGLMTLYDQGKLDLDRDISDYLPFQVRNPAYPDVPITARMLLSHTSSISKDASTYKPNWEMISRSYDPIFNETVKPGTKYEYADYNGALVGCLIEAISGESVQNYLSSKVFRPLGLTAGFTPNFLPDGTPTKDTLAADGHVALSVSSDRNYPYNNTSDPRGNNGTTVGMLYINTESLTKLAQMMLNGGELNGKRILSRETVSLMEADQPGLASSPYGLSNVRETMFPRGTWYGHQGRYAGLTSNVYYQVETGLTLALVMDGYDYQLENNIVMPAVTLMKNMELLENTYAQQ